VPDVNVPISLDAKGIQQYIADAIIASSIGAEVKRAIDEQVKKLGYSYENAVSKAVADAVKTYVIRLVDTEYKEQLREAVKKQLNEEVINKVVSAVIDRVTSPF
jgi:glutamyl-tRNA reductase